MVNNDHIIQLLPSACCTVQIISNDKVSLGSELKPKKSVDTAMPIFLFTSGQFIFLLYFNVFISKDMKKIVLNRPRAKELNASDSTASKNIIEDVGNLMANMSFEINVDDNLLKTIADIADNIIEPELGKTIEMTHGAKLKSFNLVEDMYFGLLINMLTEYIVTFHHGYLIENNCLELDKNKKVSTCYFRLKSIESASGQYGVGVFNNDVLYYYEERPGIADLLEFFKLKSTNLVLLNTERKR